MPPIQCDNAEQEGVCPACQAAQNDSLELYRIIVRHFNGKNFTEHQKLRSIMLAALTSVEVVAGRDDIIACAYAVHDVMEDWYEYISKQTEGNSANKFTGNGTVN